MSALASTSSACYTCVLSRTICNSSARFSRFSTSTRRKREATFWTGKKWPHHDETQSGDLLRELERMQSEDGVKIDESVFATRPGGKKIYPRPEPEAKAQWRLHRESLKEKFPEGWNPPRRISRGEMNTIRRLHALDSVQFSTPNLADQFKISAEAVRRILKSKFRTEEEIEEERVGEALLQEAELGTYDKSQGLPSRLSRRMQDFDHDDKPKYAERKTKPARPLQEGFDAAKLASKYKWAAGSKSSLAKSNPTFVERKWEDSDWDRYDRTIHPADRRDVQSEKRSVLRQRDSVIPS